MLQPQTDIFRLIYFRKKNYSVTYNYITVNEITSITIYEIHVTVSYMLVEILINKTVIKYPWYLLFYHNRLGTLTKFECLVSIINPGFSSCFKGEAVRY
jgi:hypothetical protein